MRHFIRQNTWAPLGFHNGWGCGYVVLPKNHPFAGMPPLEIPVDVHRGITFSKPAAGCLRNKFPITENEVKEECWVIGFDTDMEMGESWPPEEVEKETIRLMLQCAFV